MMRPAKWMSAKWLGAVAVAAAMVLGASTAWADGLLAAPSDLPVKERNELAQAIAAYKKTHPEAFEAVRNVKGYKPEHYKKFQNPIPMVGRELRRLGPSALLPMLEALAFDVWARDGATEAEWRALAVGMLEAVGHLRDDKSSAVLQAAFAKVTHPDLQVTSAEALGQLCNDPALATLEGALATQKRTAALTGLGECRREQAATRLAAELDKAKSPAEAEVIGRALGVVSSSWAWQAMGQKAEGLKVGSIATAALVRAFVRFGGEAQEAMRIGITMASHPDVRSIAQKHRAGADAATSKRLDALITVIERRAKR
jgi:hypothetical protein